MKKRILAISLSVAVLLVSLTVAGMLTVTADTTIDWQDGTYTNIADKNGALHSDVGQVAAVEAGTYNPDENLIKGVTTDSAALTDGLLPGDDGFTEASFTQTPGTFKVTTYDLGSVATIDRFLVAGGSTVKVSYIKIYASLTDSTPADDEANLVAAKLGLHRISNVASWLRAATELKARYVAFALYMAPSGLPNDMYAKLSGWGGSWNSHAIKAGEYGIFGTKAIKNVEETATSVKTYNALSDNMKYVIDNNILTASDVAHCHNYAGKYKGLKTEIADYMFDGHVFDRDLNVAFGDNGADTVANRMVWYEFAFSQEMDISSFLIAAGATRGIEGFDVYVTKTASAKNIIDHPSHYTPVYSYTSALGTNDLPYWPSNRAASAVMVEFGEIQKGMHLIFKFQTCRNGEYTTAGLSEIAVVGGVAPIENLGAQNRANDGTVADLRFAFELNASGVAYGEGVYRAIAPDAKVCIDGKIYTLEGYGAVVSLDGDAIAADNVVITDEGPVKEVEAEKLYEVKTENKEVIYTVVVTDVPNSNFDEPIYARAYVDYHNGIESVRVYDEVIVKTVNGVETKAAEA